MLNPEGAAYDLHERRRKWHVVVALVVLGSGACSDSVGNTTGPTTEPPAPGSILVSTETSGFLKGETYELFVDGVSEGSIEANDEVTISGLEPASYHVELGDVADNCTVEGVTVPVASDETADVSLPVECTYAEPATYTVQFSRERPNLDDGEVTVCPFGICSSDDKEWDLYVHRNSQTDPQSVIRQNQSTGVEIAHVPEVVLAELTEADFEAATFMTELVGDPFDSGRVILIRTDLGSVYALGNPVEPGDGTLTFDAALIAEP